VRTCSRYRSRKQPFIATVHALGRCRSRNMVSILPATLLVRKVANRLLSIIAGAVSSSNRNSEDNVYGVRARIQKPETGRVFARAAHSNCVETCLGAE
jgi:hypothetical protein